MRDLVASMKRRWYLTLAGILVTVALCLAAMQLVPPKYQANGSLVLLPPAGAVLRIRTSNWPAYPRSAIS